MPLIKIGPVEFNVTIANPGVNVEELRLQDLHGAVVSVFLAPESARSARPGPAPVMLDEGPSPAIARDGHTPSLSHPPPPARSAIDLLDALKATGLTDHTLTMIIRKVLGVNVTGDTLLETFSKWYSPAMGYLSRKIEEDIWALYVGVISPGRLGQQFIAVGIDKENRNIVLGVNQRSADDLLRDIKQRGVRAERVRFVMLSLEAGPAEQVKAAFPKALIGRDWVEYIDMTSDKRAQARLKDAMMSPDEEHARKIVKQYKAPAELLNYYKFEPKYWRSFRGLGPVDRIDTEIRSRIRNKEVKTKEQLDLVVAFSFIRLQYHWQKYPVDSANLNNLPHLKVYAEAVED